MLGFVHSNRLPRKERYMWQSTSQKGWAADGKQQTAISIATQPQMDAMAYVRKHVRPGVGISKGRKCLQCRKCIVSTNYDKYLRS